MKRGDKVGCFELKAVQPVLLVASSCSCGKGFNDQTLALLAKQAKESEQKTVVIWGGCSHKSLPKIRLSVLRSLQTLRASDIKAAWEYIKGHNDSSWQTWRQNELPKVLRHL